jgi:ribonucleoside-diphosphate reductase alpha chain
MTAKGWYKNFQRDNVKYSRIENRDINNPAFNTPIKRGDAEVDSFNSNLDKWAQFVSWARFMPDLFWDLITPETGGIKLDLDQRVFLRAVARFANNYCVFPRGWGKTMLQVMAMYHACLFHPDLTVALTAQTRENAARIFKEKHLEIIKFYPLIEKEIVLKRITDDEVEIVFTSGARIDVLANQQSSKGVRRRRLNIEESNLLNNQLFEDVLQPVTNIGRRTIGKLGVLNPEEVNSQINFFTTSGFRGSDEFQRNLRMVDEMAELKGSMVLGAGWELPCHFGRGETRSQILTKKESVSPIFFAQNMESRWVGATNGALVAINKLLNLRTLVNAELKSDGRSIYIGAMDVARSNKDSNNSSAIAILKLKHNKDGKLINVSLVNMITLPNGQNFASQAIEAKRIQKIYNCKTFLIDGNGLGAGLVDKLLEETYDPNTGESLGCWATMNTEHQPESEDAEPLLYVMMSQGVQHDILVNFIDFVESGKLRLLEKRQDSNYDPSDMDFYAKNILPYVSTDLLIEEVANLMLKQTSNGKFTLDYATNRIGKDKFSALS